MLLAFLVYTAAGSFLCLLSSKLLTYASRVIIARYAGPSEYGLYSLALAFLGIVTTICLLGIPDTLARFIPQLRKTHPALIPYLKNLSLRYVIGIGILVALLIVFLAPLIAQSFFHTSELTVYLRALAFVVPLSMVATIYLVFLRSYEKIGWYSFIFNFVQSFSKLFFLLAFIFFFSNTFSIIASHFLAISTMALVAWYMARRLLSFSSAKVQTQAKQATMQDISSFLFPMMLYSLLNLGLYLTDTLMLGFYKTPFEVGLYNVALPLAALLALSSEMFNQLFVPLLNRQYVLRKLGEVRELSKQLTKWIMIINVFLLILFLFYGRHIISLLFGETYLPAYPALILLSFATFFSSLTTVLINLLSMCGKPKSILISILIAFIANIFLNRFLIPLDSLFSYSNETGLIGAALATLISTILVYALLFLQVFSALNFIPLRRKGIIFSFLLVCSVFIVQSVSTAYRSILVLLIIILVIIFIILILNSRDIYDRQVLSVIGKRWVKNIMPGLKNLRKKRPY